MLRIDFQEMSRGWGTKRLVFWTFPKYSRQEVMKASHCAGGENWSDLGHIVKVKSKGLLKALMWGMKHRQEPRRISSWRKLPWKTFLGEVVFNSPTMAACSRFSMEEAYVLPVMMDLLAYVAHLWGSTSPSLIQKIIILWQQGFLLSFY